MQGPEFHARTGSQLELLDYLIAGPTFDYASFE
jgi:hypothetical protein